MRLEADVKKRMKEIFGSIGAWWFMYVPVGYGKSGIPDFIACVPVTITPDMVGKTYGFFFAPEAKFDSDRPSPMQAVQMGQIKDSHGVTFIVNRDNVEQMHEQFEAQLAANHVPWIKWQLKGDADRARSSK